MKKISACIMIGVLAFSLSACGSLSEEESEDIPAVAEAGEAENAVNNTETAAEDIQGAENPAFEEGNDISTDKLALSVDEAEEETAETEAREAEDAPDFSMAIEGSSTSESNPAPLGTWVKTAIYATQDSAYHTVYARLVKVTTQSTDAAYVQSAIEASNGYGEEYDRIDPDALYVPADGELAVIDYEVYVPADFPAPSYGMTEPKLYLSMQNIGGGGFPSLDGENVYLGIGTADSMAVRESGETYLPGNTYGERSLFVMVQGYTGYLATYSSYPDGTSSEEGGTDNMYTVYNSVY